MTELKIIILGLKKAGIILNALAFTMKDENSKKEIQALVGVISEAIRLIEAVMKGAEK